jgi:hypothetical protein
MTTLKKTALALGLVVMAGGSVAHADGFIAGLVKPFIGEHAARELDKAHENIGKPLDAVPPAVAGAVAEAIVPGSGPIVGAAVANGNK